MLKNLLRPADPNVQALSSPSAFKSDDLLNSIRFNAYFHNIGFAERDSALLYNNKTKDLALKVLSRGYALRAELQKSLLTVEKISSEFQQDLALQEISQISADNADFQFSTMTAEKIYNASVRDQTFVHICKKYAKCHNYEKAADLSQKIDSKKVRNEALYFICTAAINREDPYDLEFILHFFSDPSIKDLVEYIIEVQKKNLES